MVASAADAYWRMGAVFPCVSIVLAVKTLDDISALVRFFNHDFCVE